jgi:dTDP-4-amino-4,6-dideoxygalactose transaminase
LDIKKGDEVLVPAFSFPATANVVELVGGKPVFVDITLDDFCLDIKWKARAPCR